MPLFDPAADVTQTPARKPVGSIVRRYSLAVLFAAGAVLLAYRLQLAGSPVALPILVLGILLSAASGGVSPALLTAVLETGAAAFLLFPMNLALSVPGQLEVLAGFIAVALGVVLLALQHHRALHRWQHDLNAADARAAELEEKSKRLVSAAESAEGRAHHAIEERDRFRQQLRVSDDRLAVAATASRFVIFEWDLQQNISVTGELKDVFGFRSHTWTGYDSLIAAVVPEDREAVDRRLAVSIAEEGPLDMEFRIHWPDGEIHWVSAKGSFSYRGEQPRRMIGVFQEITQRKANEEALVRQEKLAAAGRLAATIAHEVNNPLAAAINLLYIVQTDKTLSEAGRKYIDLAQHELARAAEIAKQTLGFYRDLNEPVRVNVADLVEEVLSLYVRRMPAHIHLEKDMDREVDIWAVKGELRQVVSNLVSNAINALEKGGTLAIRLRPEKRDQCNGAMLAVGDDGPGIPSENLDRLFEPFFTTRKDVGTGLGLWVVQQIVTKHGGSIHVDSKTGAEDHGTCVSLFLPVSTRQQHSHTVAA